MKTANPCRKNYRPEIDPYLLLDTMKFGDFHAVLRRFMKTFTTKIRSMSLKDNSVKA